MSIESVSIENLKFVLSQKVRRRLNSILFLINSDIDNEEKKRLLRKESKKDLQKVQDLPRDIRKNFVVLSTLTGERRVFSLDEFDSKNRDHIDKRNLIRVYLGEQPILSTIDKPSWFEALLRCLTKGYLPLYWPSRDKVSTDFYKKFTTKELRKILNREIENPLDIWNSIEYAKKRSVSVSNLIRFYNLKNPNTLWCKNCSKTTFKEIQEALEIPIPIKRDIDGVDKDMIIYYMIISGDRETKLNYISSTEIYEKLGFTKPPQTIQELFVMDTKSFNLNKEFVRRELIRRWKEIPTILGEKGEIFLLGISRKIKYCYIANNIRDQHPDNLTHTSKACDLLLALQIIERDFE